MSIKPQTIESLILDQIDRIERCLTPKGTNAIMDWIEDINHEIPKNH